MTLRTAARILPVLVFAILCVAPLALFTVRGPWPGGAALHLPQPPAFPYRIYPRVFRDIDRWFVGHVGMRLPLLAIGSSFHTGLLKRSTDARVVIGREGWLYWTDSGADQPDNMADFNGLTRLSSDEIARIEILAHRMHDQLAACGIAALLVIAPNKQSIYPEFLSSTLVRPQTRFDDALGRFDDLTRSMILDLRPPLRAAKINPVGLPLYYKTDTHWNKLGAFFGYRAMIEALARTSSRLETDLAALDRYAVATRPYSDGDLGAAMLAAPNWYDDIEIDLSQKPSFSLAAAPEGRLLLIGDSFSYVLPEFFEAHFAAVHRVNRDNIPAHPWPDTSLAPAAVILEIVERGLPLLADLQFDWSSLCRP